MERPARSSTNWLLKVAAELLVLIVFVSFFATAQSWPRCLEGCTANDVELVAVTAEIAGSCTPGGSVEATLWASLRFNRNRTYCVRFVADVLIDGDVVIKDLVSDPFNVLRKGTYSDIYLGSVSLPCGSTLALENIEVMWSVDKKLNPVSKCQSGACTDYGSGSKCTGDQFSSYVITLPLDAQDDEAMTAEETPIETAVLANDLLGLTPTSIVDVTDGAHGSTELNTDGTITYVPDPDFDGVDAYSYTIRDSDGATDTATVIVTVLPVSDPPIAHDDTAVTRENAFVNIDVTENDVDPDGAIDPSTVSILDEPGFGSVDVDPGTGVVTYTPDPNACGIDEFTYVVTDYDDDVSNEATVTVDVVCNEPPTAFDDSASTDENTSVGINVIGNDFDPDGEIDPATIQITQQPGLGELSVHPSTGIITYTPDSGACGADNFAYTVADNDGATSNEATVTVDVMCDDPPLALDDLYTVVEGGTLEVNDPGVLSNDVTSPWEPLTAILVSDVSHGTLSLNADGSFTYVHDGSETTSDSFTYRAFDGTDDSNTATVSIAVTPTNDPPYASDDEDRTDEDVSVTIDVLANDGDIDGDSLFVDWVGSPSNGSVTNDGSDVTYTPDPDFHGVDTFQYTASDGRGGTATATVTVIVDPVNDPPIAQADSAHTDEDTPVDISVLPNDSDPDGDALMLQSVTQPASGSATIVGDEVRYVPDPNFHGIDTFTYTIRDGAGATSTATVTVTVASANDAPAALDDEDETDEDTPVIVDVLANDSDPDGDPLFVEAVSQPANGIVVNNGTDVLYTPDANFHGVDTFTYTACDGNGCTMDATVTVTVYPVNDPPVAQDDSGATSEDVPVVIDVLANDSDPDGDSLVVQSVTQPAHGAVTFGAGDLTYVPDSDFYGVDTFTYTIADSEGTEATATVTVSVSSVNDPPVAAYDAEETEEETPVRIDVLANDSDADGDDLDVQTVTQPSHGSVANDGTSVVYTPEPDFHGTDTFSYTISDGRGGTDTATVEVTVRSVNDGPVAQDDSGGTDEDVPVTVDVLANDSDPDGDDLVIDSVTQPSNGSAVHDGSDVVYTPDPGFNGSDTFTYTISDGNGGTDTATVTISIGAVNDPPTAVDDADATDEDTPVTVNVLGNDSDPDGDDLVIQSVTQPGSGSVANNGSGVVYTPAPNFHGTDTFSYTVSDGNGGTETATVVVTVRSVNDEPVAQDDSGATDEDVPVTIDVLANDSDPDGDDLVIASVTQPSNGSAAIGAGGITYTPDPGFNGSDTFTYSISDGNGGSDTAAVTVSVGAVNDPPTAVDDARSTDEDTAVTVDVLGNDSDPDGDSLTVLSVSQPSNGSATVAGDSVTYTPDTDFHGVDAFTYTVSDGNGGTDAALVTITVEPTNDPPVAQDDSGATQESVPVSVDVLVNDSDPDGDSLTIESVTQPSSGSAAIDGNSVTYTPAPGFNGSDTFTYTIGDGAGGTSTATVVVAVAVVNGPPIALDDVSSTVEDAPVTVRVLPNDSDPDGDSLSIQSVTQPEHGTAVPSGTSILYTPSPNYSGPDAFTYTISDGNGGTATATVVIDVVPANDPPSAQGDIQTTTEDSSVTVAVLSNDSDPDGDPLVVESIGQPAHGTVVNNGDSIEYTPDAGFSGVDTFTYVTSDGQGGTDTAVVTVVVGTLNDPPSAQDDSASTNEDTLVSIPVLENDQDPDGDFLLVETFSQAANGTVLNTRTGVSYIPNPGFQGLDTFTYAVSDGNGGTDTATVTVSVAAVNDPPNAADDTSNTDEGVAVEIPILLNDTDPDGDPLTIQSVIGSENGTVRNLGDAIEYTPSPDFNGVDQFSYVVTDGQGGTDTATVYVAVAGTNDPPIAQDDSASTSSAAPVTIPVLSNDSDPDGDPIAIESASTPAGGDVRIDGGNLVYTPRDGYVGTDRFTYTITDALGGSDQATVTIGVTAGGQGGAIEATACEGAVIISEIAWAGTSADPRDEWIELRNLGTSPVDLSGWTLQWRPTRAQEAEDQVWKQLDLSGVLAGAQTAACDELADATSSALEISKGDGIAWTVTGSANLEEDGYFILERRHDDTIADSRADVVYDTAANLVYEFSDGGDIVMLLDPSRDVVSTANAPNLGRSGWVAGSAVTYGTMERIDPLGPDVSSNWHTNLGIVAGGKDADGQLLRATPRSENSPALESLSAYAAVEPTSIQRGETAKVSFALTRQDRRYTGWPWISVSRPGFAGVGGSVDLSQYSFAGQHTSSSEYTLDIGTTDLAPGAYTFLIIYGEGDALLVPIHLTP